MVLIKITLEDTIAIKVHPLDKLPKPSRHSAWNIQRSHSESYNNDLSDLRQTDVSVGNSAAALNCLQRENACLSFNLIIKLNELYKELIQRKNNITKVHLTRFVG